MDKQDNINLIEEAKSETTSGDRLKELAALNDELASHKSKAVRKAVISNRNTLTEALFKFGEYFDRELLDSTTFISHLKIIL